MVNLLFDDDFIEKTKINVRRMDPICELINNCQKSNVSVADAAEMWMKLCMTVKNLNDFTSSMKESVEKRAKMATNVYGLTANYLHPKYRGKMLSSTQTDLVEDFLLVVLDDDGLISLHEFQNNENIFKCLAEKNVNRPDAFWGLTDKKHPGLSRIADRLLKIPASSAQLERVFSNWSWIHSNVRNRLSQEKSKKLINTYYSLKVMDKNVTDQY